MLSDKKNHFEQPNSAEFGRQRLGFSGNNTDACTSRSFWRQTSSSQALISTRKPYLGRATVCVRINRQVVLVKDQFFETDYRLHRSEYARMRVVHLRPWAEVSPLFEKLTGCFKSSHFQRWKRQTTRTGVTVQHNSSCCAQASEEAVQARMEF